MTNEQSQHGPQDPPYLVIYHANCPDGACAAACALLALGEDNVRLWHAAYGQDPPQNISQYERVYIVDFSYKKDVMEELFAQNPDIVLLDHHATAEADLEAWKDDDRVVFDMDKSGARLAWEHFQADPDANVHPVVRYVEDRDLWRFKLPDSKAVNAYFSTLEDPEDFVSLLRDAPDEGQWAQLGDAVLRARMNSVRAQARGAVTVEVFSQGGTYEVPLCNCSFAGSELGNELLKDGAPFSMTWRYTGRDTVGVSLRSSDDHDVHMGELAARQGGGGHKNAAGLGIPLPLFYAGLLSKRFVF